jgi:CheY-like chemotaxis protein
MDVQMPEMDGIETNQINRQQLSLDRLPIVALTAGTLVQEKKRVFDSGINDFLTKPIEPFRLISTVRKLVESYRSRVINIERLTSANVVMSDNWPIILDTKDSRDLLNKDENEVNPLLEEVAQHLTNFRLYSAEFLSRKQYITDEHTETDIQNIPSINLEHIKILTSRLKR